MEEHFIDTRNSKRHYELALARFYSDTSISDRNKEIVRTFLRDAALGKTVIGRAKKKISVARLHIYVNHLQRLIAFSQKDLDDIVQEEMEHFIEALETDRIRSRSPRVHGANSQVSDAPLSDRYKVDIKVTIKKFYKWLSGNKREYPQLVEWIDTYHQDKEIHALTEGEVERLLDRGKTPLQRALVQVFFDGGFRIGELLNVRLHHVRLHSFEADDPSRVCFIVRVPFSKTLRRTVALPMQASTKWLRMWLEDHPANPTILPDGSITADNVSAQLFPISEGTVRTIIRHLGEQALRKRVYPHLLRHTSATYWSNRLPYFKFCKRFGWTMTSDMPQRYIDREGVDELEVAQIHHGHENAKLARENQRLIEELTKIKSQ